MATKRIKDLTTASTFGSDDVIAIDNEGNGTRSYNLEQFKTGIIQESKEYTDQVITQQSKPIFMNPFNLDYTNMIVIDMKDKGTAPVESPFEIKIAFDSLVRIPRYYQYSSYSYTRDTASVLSVNSIGLKDTYGVNYYLNSFRDTNVSSELTYYDIFMEAGDTLGLRYSYDTRKVLIIPLRHGDFDEEMISYTSVQLSDIMQFKNYGTTTPKLSSITKDQEEYKTLSGYFTGIDEGTDLIDVYFLDKNNKPTGFANYYLSDTDVNIMSSDVVIGRIGQRQNSSQISCMSENEWYVKTIEMKYDNAFITKQSNDKIVVKKLRQKNYVLPKKNTFLMFFDSPSGYHIIFPKDQSIEFMFMKIR